MKGLSRIAVALLVSAGSLAATAQENTATGWSWDHYGSLRMQVESVRPDRRAGFGSYSGLRDAYSRFGANLAYRFDGGARAFAQIEVPFDSANFRLRDPYDQGGFGRDEAEPLRIARVGLEGRFGTLSLGQQWMPYYNAIAAPVDWFSSYYSGFATYTTPRVRNTVAWYSPRVGGFGVAASWSAPHGNKLSTARIDDRRWQATASWNDGPLTIAAGLDDRGNADGYRDRLYGLTTTWQREAWYLAFKYERTDTNVPGAFYGDDQQAYNLLGAYTRGRNTWKLMVARVEGYGEDTVHFGVDHRYSDALTFFAEFYSESETAAITDRRRGLDRYDATVSGGRALSLGLRYDF